METWTYIIIILCLLLLAFMSWKEWQRMNKSRLVWRMIISVCAVASFACLALPLSRKVQLPKAIGKQAILLTEGFNRDSVNKYLLPPNNNIPIYAFDNSLLAGFKKYKVHQINVEDLSSLKQQVASFHMFGYGLDQDLIQSLPASQVVFHPSKVMDGITSATWQHKIKTGEQLRVQGNFINSSPVEIKLVLSGYDTNLDTAIIPANKNTNFELLASPKQFGKAVYSLTAIKGMDTLEKEPVPFETQQPDNLKILILAASPDFENKFLKSWLSQNSYAFVTRTTISKNKYEKTFLNTPQVAFNSITTSFLKDFGLLIADVSELTAISSAELGAIESQVAQKGMGLIVKGDSTLTKTSFYSKPFPVIQNADNNQKALSLYIPVNNQYTTAVTTEHPNYIRHQPGTQNLIEDKQSNVIVSSTIYGAGKMIYSTLNNTFTWMLSGDSKNYETFWAYLLNKAIAKTGADKSWSIGPAYPYINKAVEINYSSNSVETPRVQVGKDFVHLIQNPDLPFQWQGTYWPERSGWQPILEENNKTFWWYAYNTDDWKTMSALQKLKVTLQHVSANGKDISKDVDEKILVSVPLSKIYFFLIFLCSVGFLWLEKKL